MWCVKYFIVYSFCKVFCDYGGVYYCGVGIYVLFCNGVWVSVDVCCVSSDVECGLFLGSLFSIFPTKHLFNRL